jgi:hypothetical protein
MTSWATEYPKWVELYQRAWNLAIARLSPEGVRVMVQAMREAYETVYGEPPRDSPRAP